MNNKSLLSLTSGNANKAVSILKKTASIISFLFLFYILPLSAKPGLIFHWQVIFLSAVCTVLFATQPRLSFTESKDKKSTDRNTIWLILLVSGTGQVASLIEWAYFSGHSNSGVLFEGRSINLTMAGAALLVCGTLFRIYAINVLGKYFSSTVQIKEEHKIITAGPYRYLRHPSYTGAYIAMLGSAIFLQSIIGCIIFGLGMLLVYHLRIKTEEATLTRQFGNSYKRYASRTYKMFPLVW